MKESELYFEDNCLEIVVQHKNPKEGVVPNMELSSKNPYKIYCMVYEFEKDIDLCFYLNGRSDYTINVKRNRTETEDKEFITLNN